jgi:hypothetical protein
MYHTYTHIHTYIHTQEDEQLTEQEMNEAMEAYEREKELGLQPRPRFLGGTSAPYSNRPFGSANGAGSKAVRMYVCTYACTIVCTYTCALFCSLGGELYAWTYTCALFCGLGGELYAWGVSVYMCTNVYVFLYACKRRIVRRGV